MSDSVIITALIVLPVTAIACFFAGAWAVWRVSKGNSPMPIVPLIRRPVSVATGDDEEKVEIVKPKQVPL